MSTTTLKSAIAVSFPTRGAADVLRGQVLEFVKRSGLQPGTRFATEQEIAEYASLSRSTVRRALEPLEAAGWISRRAGTGTFIGRRVAQTEGSEDRGEQRPSNEIASPATGQCVVRMAVLIYAIGDLAHDWYTPLVLSGIDQAADECSVSVELVGDSDSDVNAISRRLSRSRPDVLVVLSNQPNNAFIIRDAQNAGIHCLLSGTPHLGLGLPGVCENNRQAAKLAVERLVAQGHRRIGLILQHHVEQWSCDRHEAYLEALEEAGIAVDNELVYWIGREEPRAGLPRTTDGIQRYLKTHRPTAVLAGNYHAMVHLDRLVDQGAIRVPDDLSVVSFEQDLAARSWLGGRRPTFIHFPLKEMGRRLAQMARSIIDTGESPNKTEFLPATLVEGETVARHKPA